jgi:lysophospholipid acyltransferase (LPLAT)-like uncharacterized protein
MIPQEVVTRDSTGHTAASYNRAMWKVRLAGEALGLVLVAWRRSLRTTIRGLERLELHPRAVLATWHGRMQCPIFAIANRGVLTMSSRSTDGEIAARAITRLGLVPARGSVWKGGAEAYEQIRTWLKEGRGQLVGLTVDGPRGPIAQPKRGAIELARSFQIPLIPISFSSRPFWRLHSWDHMIIAPPFSRVVVELGEPLWVAEDQRPAAARAALKARLDEITERLDVELHGRSLWPEVSPRS